MPSGIHPDVATDSSNHQSRVIAFHSALSQDTIDLTALRHLAFKGIPEDHPSIRSLVWKLLLGYLPPERSQWERTSQRKEAEYAQFCRELIIDPATLGRRPSDLEDAETSSNISQAPNPLLPRSPSLARETVRHDDHPLSTAGTSRWHTYFADSEIREQIARDVDRTHPDLNFFSGCSIQAEGHRESMRRALFVYAKLNPGLRYVQGMNELFAVLYHTFATGGPLLVCGSTRELTSRSRWATADSIGAETASFFCFMDLLSEFRDNFCQQLDNSEVGIRATMGRLSDSLRGFDPVLWDHLEARNGVKPQFYAFRWITTLLTQEFAFPDALRLWDSILSDPDGRSDCLRRLCLGMVMLVRNELLDGDFAANMKLLQRYPPIDVAFIIKKAEELRHYKTVFVLDDDTDY